MSKKEKYKFIFPIKKFPEFSIVLTDSEEQYNSRIISSKIVVIYYGKSASNYGNIVGSYRIPTESFSSNEEFQNIVRQLLSFYYPLMDFVTNNPLLNNFKWAFMVNKDFIPAVIVEDVCIGISFQGTAENNSDTNFWFSSDPKFWFSIEGIPKLESLLKKEYDLQKIR